MKEGCPAGGLGAQALWTSCGAVSPLTFMACRIYNSMRESIRILSDVMLVEDAVLAHKMQSGTEGLL